MGDMIKSFMGNITKAFRTDPGRNKAMPRKGLYNFANTVVNKKQQKPYTLNPSTIARLANTDPIIWSIRRTIKSFISQTKWDIVPDIDREQSEFDRWEDLILNSINPYNFDDSAKFKSKLLPKDIQVEIEQKISIILMDETLDDLGRRNSIRWYFKTLSKRLRQEAESHKHEVKCIFEHPNTTESSFRSLMELVLDDILIFDSGIIVKNYDHYGKIAELYTRPGHEIKIYRNEDRSMPEPPDPAYVWEEQGVLRAEYTNDELVYIMQNPQQNGYGKSPLEVAAYIITASLYADEYNIDFFKNSNIPPAIINLGENVDEDQRKYFQKLWEQEIKGNGPHKILFVSGTDKIDVKPIRNMSNRDMQMMEYLKWATAIKCACYGISPQDIGFVLDFHKTTAEVQEKLSQARGINSLLNLLETAFNEEIVKAEFGFTDIKFKWLIEDSKESIQQSQIDNLDLQSGVLSINERRDKLNMKPIEGGDEHIVNGKHVEEQAHQPDEPAPIDPMQQMGMMGPEGMIPPGEEGIENPENKVDGFPGRPTVHEEQNEPGPVNMESIKMTVNKKLKKKDQYKKIEGTVKKLKEEGINAELKIGFTEDYDENN